MSTCDAHAGSTVGVRGRHGKQPAAQWLDRDAAARHCSAGAGEWSWAGNDGGYLDVVMACAGDVPTLETLAAVTLLRSDVPDIRIRVVTWSI